MNQLTDCAKKVADLLLATRCLTLGFKDASLIAASCFNVDSTLTSPSHENGPASRLQRPLDCLLHRVLRDEDRWLDRRHAYEVRWSVRMTPQSHACRR